MSAPKAPTLLIADDSDINREMVVHTLGAAGLFATAYASGDELLAALPETALVCVLDMRMPGKDGLVCLREIKQRSPHTQVILLTGVDEARTAVMALKAGAYDYLTKPFSPTDLARAVNRAMHLSRTSRESEELRQCLSAPGPTVELTGQSAAMSHVRHMISLVGPTEETVLLTGESGTGKTLAARALHAASRRAAGPFISVSCPSLPRDLLESEMFGHEKGSFSGALQKRLGRVELAEGGTLFLDEIAELPIELQAKLLTFLQERTFFRVGGETAHQANVRIIAATHQNLARLCREGRFREDLFYRLNVVPIELPALRLRPEDIAPLAARFLADFARRNAVPPASLDDDALDALVSHTWPGNIRELENTLARIATLNRDLRTIGAPDVAACLVPSAIPLLSTTPTQPAAAPTLAGRTLAEIEDLALTQTLATCGQSRAQAARLLGVSEKTVYNMLRRRTQGTAEPFAIAS